MLQAVRIGPILQSELGLPQGSGVFRDYPVLSGM